MNHDKLPPLASAELEALRQLAETAGGAIMEIYAGAVTAWSKDDQSPLTEADLRADEIIRRGIEAGFPGTFILSEESRSSGEADPERFFLVDPLDGTKEFLKRNGEFTVNIALVEQGRPVAGIVCAPALGETFYAALGHGAWLARGGETRPLVTQPASTAGPWRIVGSRSHGSGQLEQWLAGIPAHSFIATGSSLKFCRIAEGIADMYPRFGPTSQWDTAAGQCVLEIAGGTVFGPDGESLRYGPERPILNPFFIALGDPALKPRLPPFA